jgi:hypothetical protein
MSQFDDAISNVRSMKDEGSIVDKAEKTIRGSAMGAIIGLMYAWYNQKNIYVYGIMGAIGGGIINYALLGLSKKEKDEQ